MMSEQNNKARETIRVAAPVVDADIPVCSEVLNALPDPADSNQAIVVNVPVLVDWLNFGDIVRLAPADEAGVRPIVEVVVASGHVHLLAATGPGEGPDLVAELERMFPSWAFRFALASDTVMSVSVHPHLDAEEVADVIAAWLAEDLEDLEDAVAMTEPCRSDLGTVTWA
jgi:hypothetical protein